MARSWHYPRWKRLALQFALLLVLGLTLGLAELVARHQRAAQVTVLGPPATVGRVTIRLPKRWVAESEDVNTDSTVIHAQEPDADRHGRVLTIAEEDVPFGTSLDRFLKQSGLGPAARPIRDNGIEEPPRVLWKTPECPTGQEPVTVANCGGRLIAMRVAEIPPEAGRPTIWVAAALLNPFRAVAVQLECPDDQEAEADKQLIVDVARGISIPK
jgi:hypothetical protein